MTGSRYSSLVAVLLLALVAAACGNGTATTTSAASTTSTTAQVTSTTAAPAQTTTTAQSTTTTQPSAQDEAKALVAAAEAALTEFPAPGPAFDASAASGKMVWYENYSASSSTTAIWRDNFVEAMKLYGVEVVTFDGQGQIAEQARGLQQAVAQGADLIIISGIAPGSVAAQIADAAAAGIPVVVSSNGVADLPGVANFPEFEGVVAAVTINHIQVGTLLADAAVAQSGDAANVQMVTHSSVMGTQVIVDSLKNELARLCPDCGFAVEDLPFSRISTLPELAQLKITGNPALTQIIPVYDWETLNMTDAVTATGSSVTLESFNANPAVIEAMAAGAPISADVGAPNAWVGWATADQALRILTGNAPVADERIPLRLFTPNNVGQLDLAAGEDAWYGSVDYKAEFQQLWSGS